MTTKIQKTKNLVDVSQDASEPLKQNTIGDELNTFDLRSRLPDLDKAEVLPLDLMSDYWTPEKEGETKRVFFQRIGIRDVLDQETEEVFQLECAFFVEKVKGDIKSVVNGSKRLVGSIEANNIQHGTPLQITYLGKRNNSTNAYKSDNWSIKPLIVKKR